MARNPNDLRLSDDFAPLDRIDIEVWNTDALTSDAGVAGSRATRVNTIVEKRCAVCHSTHPTYRGVGSAPRGVVLETPTEIQQESARIQVQAVDSKAMPLGNVTKMTEAERDLLARWIAQGAKIP